MSNSVIESDADDPALARHRCYLAIVQIGDEPRILTTGVWTDTLRNVDGAWRFVRRTYTRDA